MATFNTQGFIQEQKAKGVPDEQVFKFLEKKGIDPRLPTHQVPSKAEGMLNKVGNFLGLTGLAKGVTQAIFLRTREGKQTMKLYEEGKISEAEFENVMGGKIASKSEVVGSAATAGLTIATAGGLGSAGGLAARTAGGAALGAGFSAAGEYEKTGKVTAGGVATGAVFGALIPLAGAGVKGLVNTVTQKLPKRLVMSAFGKEIQQKGLTEWTIKNKKLGSLDKLFKQSSDEISKLGDDVQKILSKETGKKVSVKSIVNSVVKDKNLAGAALGPDEVTRVINKLAPQGKGLLNKGTLNLTEANQLRSLIDKTLGDRGFVSSQLPFNKDILRSFTNSLRSQVKNSAPSTKSLFSEMSKEIRFRNILEKKIPTEGAKQILSIGDFVIGGIGGAVGGVPGTIAGVAGRRVVGSPTSKVGAAAALEGLGKIGGNIASKTKGAVPLSKAALFNLVRQAQGESK